MIHSWYNIDDINNKSLIVCKNSSSRPFHYY
jgi:hypothetical protein